MNLLSRNPGDTRDGGQDFGPRARREVTSAIVGATAALIVQCIAADVPRRPVHA
jgi:hypothetical protein